MASVHSICFDGSLSLSRTIPGRDLQNKKYGMIKGEHAYGKTVSKAKLQGQSVSDGIPGEERHAKTLLEEGRRQGREESARLLQIEREENARLLQKEQEKSAQLL